MFAQKFGIYHRKRLFKQFLSSFYNSVTFFAEVVMDCAIMLVSATCFCLTVFIAYRMGKNTALGMPRPWDTLDMNQGHRVVEVVCWQEDFAAVVQCLKPLFGPLKFITLPAYLMGNLRRGDVVTVLRENNQVKMYYRNYQPSHDDDDDRDYPDYLGFT